MKETFLSPSDNFDSTNSTEKAPSKPLSFQKCGSGDTTIISDITKNGPKIMSERIISLNYSSGNSTMVLETLVAAQDLHKAMERNKKNKARGGHFAITHQKAKAATAMYQFNEFGCKIGKTALQKKRELFTSNNKRF